MKLFKLTLVSLLAGMISCTQNSCISVTINANGKVAQQDIPDKGYLSVVRLIANNSKENPLGAGGIGATGFAVSDRHIMTAGHFCVGFSDMIKLKLIENNIHSTRFNGTKFVKEDKLTIVSVNKAQDMCLLEKQNHQVQPVTMTRNYSTVHVGDKISIIGAPNTVYPAKVEGFVMLPKNKLYDEKKLAGKLFVSALIFPGNSGSPVFDQSGKVIGMAVMGSPGLTIAVRADVLIKFMKDAGITIKFE